MRLLQSFIIRQLRFFSAFVIVFVIAWGMLLPSAAFARNYIVEAVVFSHEGAASTSQLGNSLRAKKMQNTFDSRSIKARTPQNARGLSTLAGIANKLSNSAEYRVLKTLSLVQSEANYARSPLIRVTSPTVQGAIRVYAPNLLFTEINLKFSPQRALNQVNSSTAQFFIDEQRKLKLKEIHYFDHPLFGVVLSVKPQ